MIRRAAATALFSALLATLAAGWSGAPFLAPFGAPLAAQTPADHVISLDVSRDGRTVGDLITVTVTVQHPRDATLTVPSTPEPLGALDPASPRVQTIDPGAGPLTVVITYETRAFLTGTLPLQLPALEYTDAGGTRSLPLSGREIVVDSVLPAGADTLLPRPLKPPQVIGGRGAPLAAVVTPLAIAAALAAAGLVARHRRRRAARPAPVDVVDPETAAEQRLAVIRDAMLLPDEIPEHCARIRTALRAYLHARYGLPADNLTTQELGRRLGRAGAAAPVIQLVQSLFQECDAVTYGRADPAPERAARYLDLALAVVRPPRPEPWARSNAGGPAAEGSAS